MAGRHSRRGKAHQVEVPDLELMPLLNVFISIIPMLLLSAAFVQMAVIPAALPGGAATSVAPASATPVPESRDVTIHIRPDAFVVEARGSDARTITRTPGAAAAGRLQLGAALRGLAAGGARPGEVRIVPAVNTRYEDIIDVMDLARDAGLPRAALADGGAGGQ